MPGQGPRLPWEQGIHTISTDPAALDFESVYAFLSTAPWASGIRREAMLRALRNSLCFSLFEEEQQIGFARVITDHVTYAYLCDVYVAEHRRGRGLGSWLIRCVLEHPDIAMLKRIALITHDAQEFYTPLGFRCAADPSRYMERLIPVDNTAHLDHGEDEDRAHRIPPQLRLL